MVPLASLETLHLGPLVRYMTEHIVVFIRFYISFCLNILQHYLGHVKQEALEVMRTALCIIYFLQLVRNWIDHPMASLQVALRSCRRLSELNLHASTIIKLLLVNLADRLVKETLGMECRCSTHTHCRSVKTVFVISPSP